MGAFVVFKIISLFFAFGGLVAVSVDGTPHEDVRRELPAASFDTQGCSDQSQPRWLLSFD